jgi:hypothetical protein
MFRLTTADAASVVVKTLSHGLSQPQQALRGRAGTGPEEDNGVRSREKAKKQKGTDRQTP